jgi:hypothetical protein
VALRVFVDLFDGLAFTDEAEQVDGKDLLVGKIRVGVVALPLGNCAKPAGPAPTDEQINADERILPVNAVSTGVASVRVIHVAKGGL